MSNRKETPDILGSVLGSASPKPARQPDIMPHPKRKQAPARGTGPKPAASPPQPKPSASRKRARKAQAEPASPPLAWEYRDVIFYDYGGYVVRYVGGQEWPNWKQSAPAMSDYINRLGRDGWEMVGLLSPKRYHLLAIFKRPKRAEG